MKKQYFFDYSKLLGRIKEKGLTQKILANEISISETSLTSKIQGRSYFTSREIFIISDILECNQNISEYFFNLKVQK